MGKIIIVTDAENTGDMQERSEEKSQGEALRNKLTNIQRKKKAYYIL